MGAGLRERKHIRRTENTLWEGSRIVHSPASLSRRILEQRLLAQPLAEKCDKQLNSYIQSPTVMQLKDEDGSRDKLRTAKNKSINLLLQSLSNSAAVVKLPP